MKSILAVLALALGALTFQSCEEYPNGASRGYYHGGYYAGGYGGDHYDRSYYDAGYYDRGYSGDGYYDRGYSGDGYYGGSGVIVPPGDGEHHHGDGYSNE